MPERLVRLSLILIFVTTVAFVPTAASAQTQLDVSVTASASCDLATFNIEVVGGSGSYDVTADFGDGQPELSTLDGTSAEYTYTYPTAGVYNWSFLVTDTADTTITGMAAGTLDIGPQVTLTSDPFPPVLTLDGGTAGLNFTADVTGAEPPVTYSWDLDGDGVEDAGSDPNSNTASFEYSQAGKYSATVEVTDNCGLPASDSLPVVVFDPEDACHPRAQQIAEAVSFLFPEQSDDTYSCEDIFGIFNGDLTGDQLGFGRMWHAYQLAASLEELTWQEILDWHLNQGGWGLLTQLDRYSEALTDIGLKELTQMVINGEASVKEVRTAVRSAVRFEADFEDALSRIQDGANPGELKQFYQLAADLELETEDLDAYLEGGLSLPELKHLGSLSSRYDADLDSLVTARENGSSWGELNQAYRLADDETSAADILADGVKEYRQRLRDEAKAEREAARAERNQTQQQNQSGDKDEKTRERLIAQYGESAVESAIATCGLDWGCVRKELRGDNQPGSGKNKNK